MKASPAEEFSNSQLKCELSNEHFQGRTRENCNFHHAMRLAQCTARPCAFRAAQVALLYFTTMILLFAACIAECFGASKNFPPLLSQNDPAYLQLGLSRVC